MKDPRMLALRERVEAVGDPALTDVERRWRCVTGRNGTKPGAAHNTAAARAIPSR